MPLDCTGRVTMNEIVTSSVRGIGRDIFDKQNSLLNYTPVTPEQLQQQAGCGVQIRTKKSRPHRTVESDLIKLFGLSINQYLDDLCKRLLGRSDQMATCDDVRMDITRLKCLQDSARSCEDAILQTHGTGKQFQEAHKISAHVTCIMQALEEILCYVMTDNPELEMRHPQGVPHVRPNIKKFMPPPTWTNPEQDEFIAGCYPEYQQCQGKQDYSSFWPLFFKKCLLYPEKALDIDLTEVESIVLAATVEQRQAVKPNIEDAHALATAALSGEATVGVKLPPKLETIMKKTRELYQAELPEVKAEVTTHLQQMIAAKEEREKARITAGLTVKDKQFYIDKLAPTLAHFFHELHEVTGWAFTVLMGSPSDHLGGSIDVNSFHVGVTGLGNLFDQAYPEFNSGIMHPFSEFLVHCVCPAAIPAKEDTRSDVQVSPESTMPAPALTGTTPTPEATTPACYLSGNIDFASDAPSLDAFCAEAPQTPPTSLTSPGNVGSTSVDVLSASMPEEPTIQPSPAPLQSRQSSPSQAYPSPDDLTADAAPAGRSQRVRQASRCNEVANSIGSESAPPKKTPSSRESGFQHKDAKKGKFIDEQWECEAANAMGHSAMKEAGSIVSQQLLEGREQSYITHMIMTALGIGGCTEVAFVCTCVIWEGRMVQSGVEEDIIKKWVIIDWVFQILKAALSGKSLVSSSTTSAGPRTKSKIWELLDTSPGMVSAVAVVACGVLSFFNDALFPDSSNSAFESTLPVDTPEDIDYEEAFECAMEMGLPPPVLPGAPSLPSSSLHTSAAAPVMVIAPPTLNSISAAMQLEHLNLGNPPVPNGVAMVPKPALAAAAALAPEIQPEAPMPMPKPKSRRKGKVANAGTVDTALSGLDKQLGTGSTTARKTRARSNK
ncbi:hypothetical protein PAXINDRAFT_152776 [Paxillus involutus ATCC 200175]|nr:hypothetical protein PAXINDRAFT_152776 [Paxillus involutus ATCC 200175]